ncbi:hypothetical protein FB566_4032 [Stackebrandtia endophytica]|uniref:Ribonuclease VapC n=1 Tax=Stackebrandtia endophytica TaxID=1496996 RepID=A0A543B0S9_9ACTN|nr:type II toxin-antitoxin system VapC family toxin [Stackebrandtia endophytica]TQL78445.1 hypothetical protein FB566_4032 [Stackebrandtia endophytica]
MQIVDVNVLLYASNEDSHHHSVARRWLDAALNGTEVVGFCWVVILAYIRISTNPKIFPHPLSERTAADDIETWLSSPTAVIVEPTPRHIHVLSGLLTSCGTAGNLVTDAHIAALALEHQASVVSFDADFGRFEGVNWNRPG